MEAFHTSLTWGVEAIVKIIPIHLYLDKVSGRHYLRVASLPKQHAINSLLNYHHSKEAKLHWLTIDNFTEKQSVIRRECGQTLGRVRVRTVVIISLQWTKG